MKLPINICPILSARNSEAYIFAMLTAKGGNHLPFLLSRYISIAAYDDVKRMGNVIGYNNNYVDYYFWISGKLQLDTVRLPNYAVINDLSISIIKALMDDGEYVIGIWNEQKIPGKMAYQKQYMAADFLLFGYDDEKQVFFSIGWIQGEFKEFSISYSNVEKALYLNLPLMHLLWGVRIADKHMGFHVENVIKELHEFSEANGRNNDSCAFGYKAIEYLSVDVRTRQKANGYFDYRELLFLVEYTHLMSMRIEYMIANGIIMQSQLLVAAKREEATANNICCCADCDFDMVGKAIYDMAQNLNLLVDGLIKELEMV